MRVSLPKYGTDRDLTDSRCRSHICAVGYFRKEGDYAHKDDGRIDRGTD